MWCHDGVSKWNAVEVLTVMWCHDGVSKWNAVEVLSVMWCHDGVSKWNTVKVLSIMWWHYGFCVYMLAVYVCLWLLPFVFPDFNITKLALVLVSTCTVLFKNDTVWRITSASFVWSGVLVHCYFCIHQCRCHLVTVTLSTYLHSWNLFDRVPLTVASLLTVTLYLTKFYSHPTPFTFYFSHLFEWTNCSLWSIL